MTQNSKVRFDMHEFYHPYVYASFFKICFEKIAPINLRASFMFQTRMENNPIIKLKFVVVVVFISV